MSSFDIDEFGRVHSAKLEELEAMSDGILEVDEYRDTVSVTSPGSAGHVEEITEGLALPEDIVLFAERSGDETSPDRAEAIARAINAETLGVGLLEVGSLLGTVTLFHELERIDADEDVDDIDTIDRLLVCEAGIWTESGTDLETTKGNIVLDRISLTGLEHYLRAKSHRVVVSSDGVDMSLYIIRYGESDTIPVVNFKVRPTEDPVFERAFKVLGLDFTELMPYFTNSASEDELDDKLSEMWLRYQGTSMEEEMKTLLDDIRHRILASRSAREVRNLFGNVNLPTIEHLDDFATALNELQ